MSDWTDVMGVWQYARDGDKRALAIYERHYSAYQYVDGRKRNRFVGPGEWIVLLSAECDALFVWRKTVYRLDGQTGIECAVFRNESPMRSSDLIRQALPLAWERWPDERRIFTYVNPLKIQSINPGYCFKVCGFKLVGQSQSGLHLLEYFKEAAGNFAGGH